MSELSPAAYAVLSAVTQREYSLDPEDIPQLAASISSGVAVALSAAADQVVPQELPFSGGMRPGGTGALTLDEAQMFQRSSTRRRLLAIAAELKNASIPPLYH